MAVIAKKLQPAKTAAIEDAKKILGEYSDYIFVDYRGLTVEQITKLRDKLREKDATLKVFKNTFARVAFDELKNDSVAEFLSGPTAIAMVKQDANESAKVLFDFTKDAPNLVVKGMGLSTLQHSNAAHRYAYVYNQRSSTQARRYIAGICRKVGKGRSSRCCSR